MNWPSERSIDGGLDQIVVDGVGTSIWLCGKHLVGRGAEVALARVTADADADAIADGSAEIVTILCLCQPHEIDARYPEYVAWLTANEGARAMWRPIPDLTAPEIDQARALAGEINAKLDDGGHVLVHCGAGMGRAPTIAICALIDRGYPQDVLLEAIAASRPLAGPENGDQMDLVERFSRSL